MSYHDAIIRIAESRLYSKIARLLVILYHLKEQEGTYPDGNNPGCDYEALENRILALGLSLNMPRDLMEEEEAIMGYSDL